MRVLGQITNDYSITQDQRHNNIKMRKITTVEEIKMSVTG